MPGLITDTLPLIFTLTESETSGSVRKLRGLFHLAETKNANGRVYPRKLLERELKRILPAVKDRRILGEISHPDSPTINLERSSHLITNIKMDGNKMYGELETLKTPAGRILEGLIESGVKLGISSRGLGSLRESDDGTKYVQEDYGLITWDVVPNPSTPDAWLGESMNTPIYIHMDEWEIIEFPNEFEIFESKRKITLESDIKHGINRLFGGK